jgi:hypothetical protein
VPIDASELVPLPWSTSWRGPRVAQVLRELLGVSIREVAFGLPRPALPLPSPHARFTMGTAQGGDTTELLVPHGAVRVLADRLLGGSSTLSEGAGTGAPLPAELGAVAYLWARLAAATETGWLLHDAQLDATLPRDAAAVRGADLEDLVRWPVAVHTELGPLALQVAAPRHAISCSAFSAELVLADDAPTRTELRAGDVVLAAGAALSLLGSGLCGPLTLRVAGLADEVAVRVGDGKVRGLHLHARRPRAHELVVAARQLDGGALVGLLGPGLHWPLQGEAPALLRVEGRTVAEGELVWLRGALGMRVTRLVD